MMPYALALQSGYCQHIDYIQHYVDDLQNVVDMAAIAKAGIKIGVDPLGGSGIAYWPRIAERYGIDITVVNDKVDPAFAFMPLDKDGQIRMDCSSAYAMANLIQLKDQFDIAIGNDPDFDRHGIVTRSGGLMNPNHYLAVAINYLLANRPDWAPELMIGKTLVSSALIDRVVAAQGRVLSEVPVGFKWFVDGLHKGEIAFGGEESAGASFLRHNGKVWSTDKDGFILGLLAAEMLAVVEANAAHRRCVEVARLGQGEIGALVADAVVDLRRVAAARQHAGAVQRGQVLAHVGLRGVDFRQQLRDIFFLPAQRADDLQPDGCGHQLEEFGGAGKHGIDNAHIVDCICQRCRHRLLIDDAARKSVDHFAIVIAGINRNNFVFTVVFDVNFCSAIADWIERYGQ